MSLPHPWRRLRELAHITLRWHDGGPRGQCKHSTQEISIRRDLSQAERRSALAHELEHLARGPAIVGHVARDEADVTDRTARYLIPFGSLVDALLWANDDHELAEALWVDVYTVRARLAGLTATETALLELTMLSAERSFPE